jgi:hypothetical protein
VFCTFHRHVSISYIVPLTVFTAYAYITSTAPIDGFYSIIRKSGWLHSADSRYGEYATDWTVRGSNPGRGKRVFSKSSRSALGPTQSAIQWLPGREVDHLPPYSAEAKNGWVSTSTAPICLQVGGTENRFGRFGEDKNLWPCWESNSIPRSSNRYSGQGNWYLRAR